LREEFSIRACLPLVLVLPLLVAACDSDEPPSLAPEDASAVAAAVDAMHDFAVDLYHAFTDAEDGNLVFSPSAIAIPVAMLRAGAAGNTAAEIDTALHAEGLDLPAGLGPLNDLLSAPSGRYAQTDGSQVELNLRAANALWGQKGLAFLDPFLRTLDDAYGSPVRPTDFRAAPGAALEQINAWVDEQTAGKIPKLLGPGNITSLTRVVIGSAIFLDAPWQNPLRRRPRQHLPPP